MPTIAIVDGVIIEIYPHDHDPAHVHFKYAGERGKISIIDSRVLTGKLPSAKLRKVSDWL